MGRSFPYTAGNKTFTVCSRSNLGCDKHLLTMVFPCSSVEESGNIVCERDARQRRSESSNPFVSKGLYQSALSHHPGPHRVQEVVLTRAHRRVAHESSTVARHVKPISVRDTADTRPGPQKSLASNEKRRSFMPHVIVFRSSCVSWAKKARTWTSTFPPICSTLR